MKVHAIDHDFAGWVLDSRRLWGLSQTALAKSMATKGFPWHQPTVDRVEDGSRPVRLSEAWTLADHFGVGFDLPVALPAESCRRCGGRPPDGYTCNSCGLAA